MRHKDPELMKKIHDFAEDYFYSEGHSPSTTEVAVFAGISRSTSYNYLVAMDKIGMIEYDGKTIRTEKMRKTSSDNSGVELYDKTVPCGELEEIDASVSEYVNLPTSIFGSGDLFILRTSGDSMIEAGIEPGDLVVIERQENAKEGDIVVALGNENGSSLKRLIKKGRKYILHPENEKLEDIVVDKLEIQGVARFVIKRL